jgi:23S rRNA U2552 (ribose-2'-O)-methylase RlmE/FtsJ
MGAKLDRRRGRHDHYYQKAKQESYPARSVYKLEELDKRFRLFARGQRVLDLGCSPGSWRGSSLLAWLTGSPARCGGL